jgi:hypothetical protein
VILSDPSSKNVSPQVHQRDGSPRGSTARARQGRVTIASYDEVRGNATGRLITGPSIRSPMLYPTELQAQQALTIHQRRAK